MIPPNYMMMNHCQPNWIVLGTTKHVASCSRDAFVQGWWLKKVGQHKPCVVLRTLRRRTREPLHCARTAHYFPTRFPPKRPQAHPFQTPLNLGHPNYHS